MPPITTESKIASLNNGANKGIGLEIARQLGQLGNRSAIKPAINNAVSKAVYIRGRNIEADLALGM